MANVTVYLDDDLALAIRQISDSTGKSQAEIIREALAEYVKRAAGTKPKRVGQFRSGRLDVSERAEELLREAARRRMEEG